MCCWISSISCPSCSLKQYTRTKTLQVYTLNLPDGFWCSWANLLLSHALLNHKSMLEMLRMLKALGELSAVKKIKHSEAPPSTRCVPLGNLWLSLRTPNSSGPVMVPNAPFERTHADLRVGRGWLLCYDCVTASISNGDNFKAPLQLLCCITALSGANTTNVDQSCMCCDIEEILNEFGRWKEPQLFLQRLRWVRST